MLARLALPLPFSLDTVVRSHGWYDLPPFDYDRDAGILRTQVEVGARDRGPGESAEIRFRVRNWSSRPAPTASTRKRCAT